MEGNEVKKSLFVRVFEVVIRFVLRFRIPVLVFVALVTAFFIRALFSLQIDANIFSFSSIAPPAEYVKTPSQAPQGEPLSYSIPEGVEEFVPEQYGHVERPEDEKLHADIPDDMRTGDRNRYYGDGFVIVFSSRSWSRLTLWAHAFRRSTSSPWRSAARDWPSPQCRRCRTERSGQRRRPRSSVNVS